MLQVSTPGLPKAYEAYFYGFGPEPGPTCAMIWYEDEVKQLERECEQMIRQPRTVFYGSSSIRLWPGLEQDFEPWQPLNLGFGGSTLAACVWFFERLLIPVRPDGIVVYAGDNDLGDGRHPEEVLIFFQEFIRKTRYYFGNIPVVFISIKPSIARQHIFHLIRRTNQLIRQEIERGGGPEYYLDITSPMLDAHQHPRRDLLQADGLHLSPAGYALWTQLLSDFMAERVARYLNQEAG